MFSDRVQKVLGKAEQTTKFRRKTSKMITENYRKITVTRKRFLNSRNSELEADRSIEKTINIDISLLPKYTGGSKDGGHEHQ